MKSPLDALWAHFRQRGPSTCQGNIFADDAHHFGGNDKWGPAMSPSPVCPRSEPSTLCSIYYLGPFCPFIVAPHWPAGLTDLLCIFYGPGLWACSIDVAVGPFHISKPRFESLNSMVVIIGAFMSFLAPFFTH